MPDLEIFRNLPDISFIDNLSIEGLLRQGIADYEGEYSRLTGENKILYPADPMRVLIHTYVLKLYQLYQYVDRAGKQDLLKYSAGAFLDHIAALRGVTRLPAASAVTTLRFTLSAPLAYTAAIQAGTLATAGDNVFFATTAYGEIPPGGLTADLPAQCVTPGAAGNIYAAGRVKVIVQPFPYAASVANITDAAGGAEAESDVSLAERTFLAPSGYSVAGPDDAYVFWTKTYSQAISDVNMYSPDPGVVDIRVLLEGGQRPGAAFLEGLWEYLANNRVRPLTDTVLVKAPDPLEYDIDCVYYIRSVDRNNAAAIQQRLDAALDGYLAWQDRKIGRDVNPSMLSRMLMSAGIKRVEITAPVFTVAHQTQLATLRGSTVQYGGLEDD
jgi:phage-related baseplate assembly protein